METKTYREQWSSKIGFILAVVGSMIGLGNIWRFPYLIYKNGGGTFLIPYFIAILLAGIPVVILEYGFGHRYRGSVPLSYARAKKKSEIFGWLPVFASVTVMIYYCIILSWAFVYLIKSFSFAWGSNAETYFYQDFLRLSDSALPLRGFNLTVLVGLIVIWLINWFFTYRGVSGGIEKMNYFMMPLLLVIIVVITIKGLTLPNSIEGLEVLFKPDLSRLTDYRIWVDAFGQLFFSLSLALGAIVTYSSYLPEKTDLNNSAIIATFSNCSFEFIAAIGVFSILGYMAGQQGLPVSEIAGNGGVGLAFTVFPQIFVTMGTTGKIFGPLFFILLIFAGITSSLSLLETATSAFIDKTGTSREKATTVISVIGILVGMIFVTNSGLLILDILDHYVNSILILGIGLVEVVFIGWVVGASELRDYTNSISVTQIGPWWDMVIKFITPLVLGGLLFTSIIQTITRGYGDYSSNYLILFGIIPLGIVLLTSILMTLKQWPSYLIDGFKLESSGKAE